MESEKEIPTSQTIENNLIELAFRNICYHKYVMEIIGDNPKIIEDEETIKKKYEESLLEYEEGMLIRDVGERKKIIKDFFDVTDIKLIDEKFITDYLNDKLYAYINKIITNNFISIKYITPLLFFTIKKTFYNYYLMITGLRKQREEEKESSNNSKEFQEINEELKRLKAHNNKIEKELKENIEELTKKNIRFEKSENTLNKKIERLEINNKELRKEIEGLKEANEELEKKIEEGNRSRLVDKEEFESKNYQKDCQIQSLKEMNESYKQESQTAYDNLRKESAKYLKLEEINKDNIDKLIKIIHNCEKKIKDLESENERIKTEKSIVEDYCLFKGFL